MKNKVGGIKDFNTVSSEERLKNFREISKLSRELTERLSEFFFGDLKRTYNMSKLASTRVISTVQDSDGTTRKDIKYIPRPTISKNITGLSSEIISIQYIGDLDYKCAPSADDYISMFIVSKRVNGEILMDPRVLFSNIDMNMLNDPGYKDAVVNTLLSKNNVELSHACGYIGEIHPQSTLEPGKEQFSSEFYTYQASTEYALVYDGVKIEAARACKEQPEIKEQIKAQLQTLGAQKRNQKQKAEEQSEGR